MLTQAVVRIETWKQMVLILENLKITFITSLSRIAWWFQFWYRVRGKLQRQKKEKAALHKLGIYAVKSLYT